MERAGGGSEFKFLIEIIDALHKGVVLITKMTLGVQVSAAIINTRVCGVVSAILHWSRPVSVWDILVPSSPACVGLWVETAEVRNFQFLI